MGKPPGAKSRGLLPTLIALLVLAGALALIGAVVWLRMAPHRVPTQPGRPSGALMQQSGFVLAS